MKEAKAKMGAAADGNVQQHHEAQKAPQSESMAEPI